MLTRLEKKRLWKKEHRAQIREQERRYRAAMTDEQRQAKREKRREYLKRWKVAKRATMPKKVRVKAGGVGAGKQKKRAREREVERQARQAILTRLGAVCVGCGHQDRRVLQIDHVYSDGAADRRRIQARRYFRTILREIESGRYQLLCANCNWIKLVEKEQKGGGESAPERQMAWAF